jgi:WD40 repeat protein
MKTTTCPQPDELRHLLDGSLDEPRRQECTDHLDACECCQARLEEIATAGTRLSQVCRHLDKAEPDATSAYWPALKALDAETPKANAGHSTTRTRELSLDFLAPASDAVYLGRLGQFDVMRIIGRGGMGVVLEAFDSRLHRNVAIKVLDPEVAGDDIARQRFCREARAAASITHENVVAVHQVEKSGDGGLPYMVMQLVNGESLEERLSRQSPLPVREIVRIGMQAAHGLEAAHAQGLIHRDIKPGNILLEPPHDRIKLTDFGLVRVTHDVRLTQTGHVSGTPLYMSPEQALGEEADHRSDLFSLGAVLYEMCTGRPPFLGDSPVHVMRQVAEEKQRPVRELNPIIPGWLAETIDRLLAKKPADRIQSAAHLAELFDFEWALMKTSSEEVPTVCQEERKRRAARTRWIAGGVGAMFLAIGLLSGKFLALRPGVSSAAPVNVFSADAGTVWSVAFDPPSQTAAMAVEDGFVRLWDLQSRSVKAKFEAHRGIVWALQFSHGGEWFATAGDDGLVKIWKPSSPDAIQTFQQSNAVRGLALAHDDRTLYVGDRGGGLRVWSLDLTDSSRPEPAPLAEGEEKKPLRAAQQHGAIYTVAISPGDETVATAGSDKSIQLWNAKTLTPRLQLEGHAGSIYGLAFHPDGRRLASAGWDKMVRIWDTGSGQLVKSWWGHDGDIWAVAYSPDGSMLATGGHDGAVKLWSAESGDLLATFLGHKLPIHSLAFNHDGTLLASGGRDGAMRIWKIDSQQAFSR